MGWSGVRAGKGRPKRSAIHRMEGIQEIQEDAMRGVRMRCGAMYSDMEPWCSGEQLGRLWGTS